MLTKPAPSPCTRLIPYVTAQADTSKILKHYSGRFTVTVRHLHALIMIKMLLFSRGHVGRRAPKFIDIRPNRCPCTPPTGPSQTICESVIHSRGVLDNAKRSDKRKLITQQQPLVAAPPRSQLNIYAGFSICGARGMAR